MTGKANKLSDWVGELQRHARQRVDVAIARSATNFQRFRQQCTYSTGRQLTDPEFQDACSEALTWILVQSANRKDGLDATVERASIYSPFVAEMIGLLKSERGSDGLRNLLQGNDANSHHDPLHQYEHYLASHDQSRRLERGVFYTPKVIARHIVERVDATLREEFGFPDGLADTTTWNEMQCRWPTLSVPKGARRDEPFVQILDPAAGTGVFMVEVVDRIYRTMNAKWNDQRLDAKEMARRWNAYVPAHLLPRMFAIELMPTPSVISQIVIAQKLAETGYEFTGAERLRFFIADTLLDPTVATEIEASRETLVESNETPYKALFSVPFTVVLGNPPFRGVSNNPSSWIGELLRGLGPDGEPLASYYEVDGEPLRERKLWLQDDYVKFMRYAHWQIERSRAGIVGFVTNHGYLDNTTFRGMRQALLTTFQRIEVFDLQGNRKKTKAAPDGGVDEGMFEIEQGVAIGIFSRTHNEQPARVFHREVWGVRESKEKALAATDQVSKTQLNPHPPHYLFVPVEMKRHAEYEAGFALNEVMPVNSTAVVTARDSFVVGFDAASVEARMHLFCDASVSDDEIRNRFFTNSRSTKYPPGDTRGWKLADARRRMIRESNRSSFLRPCLYRPFDRRTIFWAEWMVDWPRPVVMRHMITRPNIALVARRQMPPTGPCNFFWITDTIALDGLIRSDNRGSESVFPLWLDSDSGKPRANFTSEFVAALARTLGLEWHGSSDHKVGDRFGPSDVLHYIYALFNLPLYRLRYAEDLRRDFPRVLIPKCHTIWTTFCSVGESLTRLHLMNSTIDREDSNEPSETVQIGAGYPKFERNKICFGREGPSLPASERVWNFHVGTHQVCRKWLRDRRVIEPRDLRIYKRILASISKTVELTDRLEIAVADAGGCQAVFAT
ncbi:MAG: hypothetical protein H8E66_19955 [Planctomycetes bacterium]|nr:hypothetical protein [Planctomycetota bacterium]